MKKLTILVGAFASILLISGMALATPYAVNFDADAAGTTYFVQEIWGWDLEAVAKESIGGGFIDIVTHQQLGADGILSNGDTFYENITVQVLNGLGAPPAYGALQNGYEGFPPIVPAANLYIDIALDGFIAGLAGPANTTASNPSQILLNSFTSIFTNGSATMYVDADSDMAYDVGETLVASFDLAQAGNFIIVPSVFSGAAATIDYGFQATYFNPAYFSNAAGFPDFQNMIAQGFLFTLTQGGVAYSGLVGGDTAADPDEILLGWQETGFDAKFDAIPEPSTILLLGCGLIGIAAIGRKKLTK